MTEIEKLKYWIDAELTINHIYYMIILGVLIGGRFWFVVGGYIAINVIYVIRRGSILPRNYLSVKGKKRDN